MGLGGTQVKAKPRRRCVLSQRLQQDSQFAEIKRISAFIIIRECAKVPVYLYLLETMFFFFTEITSKLSSDP